ncbi:MAG: hypothetical protein WC763_02685 [Candidatus Paceibacterota bacterium]|jgi:hypothetical protein
MFNVADYFKKFSKIEETTLTLNGFIRKALKEVCGIDTASFEVKKGVIILKTNSIVKSIVFMKKKEVLEHLSKTSPSSKISDIR